MHQQCTIALKNAKKSKNPKKIRFKSKKSDLNKKIWFFSIFY